MKKIKPSKYKLWNKKNLYKIGFICANSNSMTSAARKMKMPFSTFKRHAEKAGVYITNAPGRGISKKKKHGKSVIHTNDILSGKHPFFNTNALKKRILLEGLKEHKCEICKGTEWLGNKIPLELDHKDGIRQNHEWENIRLLCPNCHSTTETYKGKNRGSKVKLLKRKRKWIVKRKHG